MCSGSDLAEGEAGRSARVLDADSLALDTGLRVRLAEVEAPAAGYGDRASEPGAEAARAVLERAALRRQARLWYSRLSRDRYARAIAHVIASDEVGADAWLNGLAVRQGAAGVWTYRDNATRARRLLALEDEARSAAGGCGWSRTGVCGGWTIWRARRTLRWCRAWCLRWAHDRAMALPFSHREGSGLMWASGWVSPMWMCVGAKVRLRGRIDMRPVATGGDPVIRATHRAQVELA